MSLNSQGWSIVAYDKQCDGTHVPDKTFKNVNDCANKCKDNGSMFSFGASASQALVGLKICNCFTQAKATGECTQVEQKGFRLYKFQ